MTVSLDPQLEAHSPLRIVIWIVGALAAAAVVVTALALLLESQIRHVSAERAQLTIIMSKPGTAQFFEPMMAELGAVGGLRSVRIVPQAEITQAVDGLLAEGSALSGVELPTIVEILFDPTRPPDRTQISGIVERFDAQAEMQDDAGDLVNRIGDLLNFQRIGLLVLALCWLSIIAVVALAYRSSLAFHHDTLDLLRTMGAEDRDLARQLQAKTANPLLLGVLFGFTVGLAGSVLLLWAPIAGHLQGKGIGVVMQPLILLLIALVPMIAGSTIVLTVKLITQRYLRQTL